ncbi:nuclear nucleic acid-binding protein C1D [Cephus cinctus]|uniref:Nuclear nucleic acid-binding protein C1D n=1 Tax=Cephus cinctus TaxID=211228 RepID=A0AAJ7W5M1_CEPCN|nr:nuclear nucleic acid-binding protein C1D [Cephus cinctus]XP_015605007.1 nuclear nucleic acid-binding protein C1D [Cephus cinctus]XP_015605008.1 nuclear nucleic acid-binding protein C1D [Cephus cinctus]XP_024945438.1 nuclear nucleic acid-binding protein C1D [Cephus cinctus]XP_024945439.1 nuclear nucleic acid-binding protein C1D [Cephus cinctus]XP_024945440.1 nuclear nucleic acid-binding protein C1D [Cephus cinctus]XP_024945441.1 nuclear nucleic acid-binding protein C1D [Cephus cinctus]
MDTDFAELSNDANLIARMTQFGNASENIQNFLKLSNDPKLYDKLSNSEKIQYNLLMSFSINSLFWMYLRAEGIDPTKHEIKSENDRLKQSMARAKQINDKNTIMPRVNRDVAQRFIRSGLWDAKDKRDKDRKMKD